MENNTASEEYFHEIQVNTNRFLRKILPTNLPYSLNLKFNRLGRTLEIGSGLGRNLSVLPLGSIGFEHNTKSADYCRRKLGLTVLGNEQFQEFKAIPSNYGLFDSILISHVLEHVELENQLPLIVDALPLLKHGGKLVLITPQERGFDSTNSHITWTDFGRLIDLTNTLPGNWSLLRKYSFPFPRFFGKVFTYNEFIVVARKLL